MHSISGIPFLRVRYYTSRGDSLDSARACVTAGRIGRVYPQLETEKNMFELIISPWSRPRGAPGRTPTWPRRR